MSNGDTTLRDFQEGPVADAFQLAKERDEIAVSGAPTAAVCGVAGCRDTESLLRVILDGAHERVVCPEHALEFIDGGEA